MKPGAEAWQPTTDLASAGAFFILRAPLNDWDEIMLENTLERLETLVAELLHRTRPCATATTSQQLRQATEENETLQLSMLEQEEKQSGTQARLEALVERLSAQQPVSA